MAIKKYLLVCEGPTDIEILNSIAKAITNKNGNVIEIEALSPQWDATTGQYPCHGWTAVRRWCQSYSEKTLQDVANLAPNLQAAILRKNWKNIVSASGSDGVIIQIDTDIAEQIVDLPATFSSTGKSRRQYCQDAICKWLNVQTVDPAMFLVLSTYSTETWLLACHEPSHPVFSDIGTAFNYEDIPDINNRLLTLGYKKKNGKLHKSIPLYRNYGTQLVNNLATVRARCVEADKMCSFLESV